MIKAEWIIEWFKEREDEYVYDDGEGFLQLDGWFNIEDLTASLNAKLKE